MQMKLLIAALLAVFSTSVMAKWTEVGGSDTSTAYADFSTIRKSGDKVKMWNLMDFKVTQTGGNGERYLSDAGQYEYDCKEETSRSLIFIWYSKNMGAGDVVWQSGNTHAEFQPIPPGSTGGTFFKLACGK